MRPGTVDALQYTSKRYARLNEVQVKVGERIAEMLNCKAAMVTAGATSALSLGPVAVITVENKEKITEIPICTDPRPEIIIQKSHRFGYDFCTTLSGARLIEVEAETMVSPFVTPLLMELLAPAVFGPWMNISGSTLANWWRRKPIEGDKEESSQPNPAEATQQATEINQ